MACFFISGKLSVGAVQFSKPNDPDPDRLRKELLFALETARSRLAIAIAEESKSTPWDMRRHYLETIDRIRLFVARLRNVESHASSPVQEWASALESLSRMDLKGGARFICRRLRGIVAALE
jgi:hypothetical protein